MKISKKLFGASLLPLFILAAGTFVSLLALQSRHNASKNFLSEIFRRQVLIAEIYADLGYGNGIHAFKNFVLRGDEVYYQNALAKLRSAQRKINEYGELPHQSSTEVDSMKVLSETVQAYLGKLEIAKQLNQNRTAIHEIDRAVKVDDLPAVRALEKFSSEFSKRRQAEIYHLEYYQQVIFMVIAGIFVLAIVVGIFISRKISSGMARSIDGLMDISSTISSGKYSFNSAEIASFPDDELKKLAEQIVEMSGKLDATFQQLLKSNEDMEQFSFIVSHELQEPAKKISAFAELIEMKYGQKMDESGQSYLQKIKKASFQTVEMIQSLLQFARLVNKGFNLNDANLSEITNEVVDGLQVSIAESNAEIEVKNKLPVVVGDEEMLKIVLNNLVSNAIKYRKPGTSPHIEISAEPVSSSKCKICVVDNGIGFDMKYSKKMTKPFFRIHDESTYPGKGIGLATVNRILAAHNTELEMESRLGEGSRFSFQLKTVNLPERIQNTPL